MCAHIVLEMRFYVHSEAGPHLISGRSVTVAADWEDDKGSVRTLAGWAWAKVNFMTDPPPMSASSSRNFIFV
jgi:hypothetical protein